MIFESEGDKNLKCWYARLYLLKYCGKSWEREGASVVSERIDADNGKRDEAGLLRSLLKHWILSLFVRWEQIELLRAINNGIMQMFT